MKENCLILGAGLMQKPAILSAKELGYKVCVVDADDKAVAISYADEFKKIDLKDKEGILEYAKNLKASEAGLAAVFTAGTDFSASVSYVCEKLDLHAHSYEAALNASIKNRMRQCFDAANVPSPDFMHLTKADLQADDKDGMELLKKVLSKLDFPFVVKPVDNMGARGCRMVRNEKEFVPAITNAIECSRTKSAILESYMKGQEFSIDALVYDGKFIVTGFAIRHIAYEPYFIELGHTMPALLDTNTHDQLISVFALGAKALGLSCGVAKADIKFTDKGPMIGEIAARLSGGYMSGWTFPYASDLNLTKEALLIASGKAPEEALSRAQPITFTPSVLTANASKPYDLYEVPCKRTAAERAWISIPGSVEYIENIKEYTDRAVFDVLPRATVSLGGQVDFPRNNVEKCGNVIAVSHSREAAIMAAQDAVSNIFITLKPACEKTQAFLQGYEDPCEEGFPPSAYTKLSPLEESSIKGNIPADAKVEDFIPEVLKNSEYINKQDWNYNTILQTAQKFDLLRQHHPELPAQAFWKSILRGGIQGAVYFSDSVK
ncbi:MAG: ATP-grasp domain-containing protein [Treponema sp.]|nr:ATP-grasp domain-containing protein [Treponema sp.]